MNNVVGAYYDVVSTFYGNLETKNISYIDENAYRHDHRPANMPPQFIRSSAKRVMENADTDTWTWKTRT